MLQNWDLSDGVKEVSFFHMKLSFVSLAFALFAGLGLMSCGIEKERQVVLPTSNESVLPWNKQLEGEGLGQFGALQGR